MIPKMTHPLGKHWRQPQDIRQAPMDEKSVLLTQRQFDELSEYSASIPTGVYEGKCWKTIMRDGRKLLRWYDAAKDPKNCSITNREILLVAQETQ